MPTTVGFVLVHGAGLGAWIWDGVVPHLSAPAVAVDLPGRGARPLPRRKRTLDSAVASVLEDAGALAADRIVVVGHSLGGIVALPVAARLGDRLAGIALVAAEVPRPGTSMLASVPTFGQRLFLTTVVWLGLRPPKSAVRKQLGHDLDEATVARVAYGWVAEGQRLYSTPVDWGGLADDPPRMYVKLERDGAVPPADQDRYAAALVATSIPTLDTGHLPMLSRPEELAALLNQLV